MKQTYGSLMLGLGLTAITAGLVSGLAANTTAFASAWTNDIYRRYLRPDCTDRHYLCVGRGAIVAAVLLSASASYASFLFKDLMEHVLLIFSIFGAPFWAIFLLGMGTRKTTERGAFYGFLCGTAVSALHLLAFSQGWIVYGSTMAANFYAAIYSFTIAVGVAWIISRAQQSGVAESSDVLSFRRDVTSIRNSGGIFWGLAMLLLAVCLALNWIWR
jgi:SSS family solute:Na+ symporter